LTATSAGSALIGPGTPSGEFVDGGVIGAGDVCDVIERKRVRLHGEREATFTEQQELDTKLAVLNECLLCDVAA
jgi:hypothetical protein